MSAYKPDLDHTKQVIFARNMPVPQSCAVAKSPGGPLDSQTWQVLHSVGQVSEAGGKPKFMAFIKYFRPIMGRTCLPFKSRISKP